MKKSTKIFLYVTLTLVGAAMIYYGRSLVNSFKKNLIQTAINEYMAWNMGQIKEGHPETLSNLRKYYAEGANAHGWSDSKMINTAWSAAFISWLMKKSGAGANFKYSLSHSTYIRDAVKNRKTDNENPFKAYRPGEQKVKKGDLVCYARQSGVGYDTTSSYKSHCDLVILTQPGKASVIGGNVANSVTKSTVKLSEDGTIDPSEKHFVIIKTKA